MPLQLCWHVVCHTFKVTSLHQGVSRLQSRLLLGVTGWTCRNMPCRQQAAHKGLSWGAAMRNSAAAADADGALQSQASRILQGWLGCWLDSGGHTWGQ